MLFFGFWLYKCIEKELPCSKLFKEGCYRDDMKLRIMIEQDEDGIFVAECSSFPGCISQGKTRNEALTNIKDAVRGYIASLKKHNEPIPPSIQEEVVEVNA